VLNFNVYIVVSILVFNLLTFLLFNTISNLYVRNMEVCG